MLLAIIGAGISGLACADVLSANGIDVVLFEKSRGAGGRISTRRIETQADVVALDHGAQYFTARTPLFRAQVDAWAALGLAARWEEAGAHAWVGRPSMTAPVKHMAGHHTVEFQRHIYGILRNDRKWWLQDQSRMEGPFDGVAVALPAEQSIPFLGMHDLSMARTAISARSQPCWTTMVVFDRRLEIKPNLIRDSGLIAWACRNSAKPGRCGPESWVIQASGAWSAANLEMDAKCVAQTLLDALLDQCHGAMSPNVTSVTAHRWRYAMTRGTDEGALWNSDLGLGACGDWLLGPRVELAWLSGRMLGERISSQPRI